MRRSFVELCIPIVFALIGMAISLLYFRARPNDYVEHQLIGDWYVGRGMQIARGAPYSQCALTPPTDHLADHCPPTAQPEAREPLHRHQPHPSTAGRKRARCCPRRRLEGRRSGVRISPRPACGTGRVSSSGALRRAQANVPFDASQTRRRQPASHTGSVADRSAG